MANNVKTDIFAVTETAPYTSMTPGNAVAVLLLLLLTGISAISALCVHLCVLTAQFL